MEIIVTFSGGKDSLAALLLVRNKLTKDFITVFCDTGWEHPETYKYINEIKDKLSLNLVVLKSKEYDGMIDLATKKKRFPSSQRRFCTAELKAIPTIDYLLDEVKGNFYIIQGIRGAESEARAKMSKQCTYFKYYLQPYGYDKNDKPKYHTYRKKEVFEFIKTHSDDMLYPIFDWSAQQVIDYILENGLKPNPLYSKGFKRVGCYPCIMSTQQDIYNISTQDSERIKYIAEIEKQIGSSFFGPDKIPRKAFRGAYPLVADVERYVLDKKGSGGLFDDDAVYNTSCMSFYSGLCE